MKIFKKLSIGFLTLIICFCSCFKFANAENFDFIDEPFYLTNNSYELFIDNSYLYDDLTIVANYSDNLISCEIAFLGNDTNILQIEGTNVSLELELTYSRDVYNPFNSITYAVYIFDFNAEELLSSYQFNYDDITICYLNEAPKTSFSVYDTIYVLIEKYIFGGNIDKGSHQDLTATILSSIICVLVFALPFLVIWKVIKVIMG